MYLASQSLKDVSTEPLVHFEPVHSRVEHAGAWSVHALPAADCKFQQEIWLGERYCVAANGELALAVLADS